MLVRRICAVSINWGVLLVGVLKARALFFGVYLRVPGFWKLPHVSVCLFVSDECVVVSSSGSDMGVYTLTAKNIHHGSERRLTMTTYLTSLDSSPILRTQGAENLGAASPGRGTS